MTRVYLIRHGATANNLAVPYRIQGAASDPPLDPPGIEQARRASDVLAGLRLAAVYSSPMLRASETARSVARAARPGADRRRRADRGRRRPLGGPDLGRGPRPGPGPLRRRSWPIPAPSPIPRGESFLDVRHRACPPSSSLASAHPGGRIAVVAHNVVNRACLAPLLGLPIDRARALRQANGGINVIDFDGASAPSVETLNSRFHLEGLDA